MNEQQLAGKLAMNNLTDYIDPYNTHMDPEQVTQTSLCYEILFMFIQFVNHMVQILKTAKAESEVKTLKKSQGTPNRTRSAK